MTSSSFFYEAQPIFFRSSGNGKPVVLLHGFGEDSHVFDALLPHLPTGYQYILPDLPGSGASPLQPTISNSIDAMAAAILALLEAEGLSSFTVLGHSMGGYIALAMMEQKPNAINGVGLIHSTAFADSEEKKTNRRKSIAFIQENGAAAFLKTAIPGLFAPAFVASNANVVDALVFKGNNFKAASLEAYYEAMIARPDRTEVLRNAQVPVLFIIGDEDKAVPMQDVLQQVYLPEQSMVHIMQGIGHMGMLEDTAATAHHIASFLALLN
ncbi:MAG: alpha/beta hydrolase [Bacteroidetes bacterium]|uniref:alpha/beta fold hydrolase n=1 Tax=Phnomibacter sp. TaxID=2836217 RepID=UPI002FDEF02E|nr:alpha/beta hydrolase [Bacteroidota bacterium]